MSPCAKWFDRIICIDKVDPRASTPYTEVARSLPADVASHISWMFIDICAMAPSALEDLIRSNNVSHVLHAAASTHVDISYENPLAVIDNNVKATTILLEATKAMPTLHVTYMSTDEVYGGGLDVLKETSPMMPTNPYSASKAAVELMIFAYNMSYNPGCQWLILRPNNMAGDWQPHKVIDRFFNSAQMGKPIHIHGDGTQVRDYIMTSDLCSVILQCMKCRLSGTYNVASSNPNNSTNIVDLAANIRAAVGSSSQIVHVADRPYNDHRYHIDDSKLRSALASWGVDHAKLTSSDLRDYIAKRASTCN